MKVETFMQMASIPHTTDVGQIRTTSHRQMPYSLRQLPYIEEDGHILADSEKIIEYLNQKYSFPLDNHLGSQERQLSRLLTNLFEQSLYWVILKSRFSDKNNFNVLSSDVFEPMIPPMLRSILPWFIRRRVLKQLNAVGIGKIPLDESYRSGIADIVTATEFLGSKSFFIGERPSTIDAIAYAFLANILWDPFPTPLKQAIENRGQLVRFCERIRSKYFIDSHSTEKKHISSLEETTKQEVTAQPIAAQGVRSNQLNESTQHELNKMPNAQELERQFEIARLRYQTPDSPGTRHQSPNR